MEKDFSELLDKVLKESKGEKIKFSNEELNNITELLNETNDDNSFWVTSLLLLMLLYFPQKEEKQPIINIFLGGE